MNALSAALEKKESLENSSGCRELKDTTEKLRKLGDLQGKKGRTGERSTKGIAGGCFQNVYGGGG